MIMNSNLFTEYITEIKSRLKNSAACLYTGTFTKPKYCPYVQSTCIKEKIRRILLLMFETRRVKESREFLCRQKYLFLCVKKWGVKIRYKKFGIWKTKNIFQQKRVFKKRNVWDSFSGKIKTFFWNFFSGGFFPMCDSE